MQLTASQTLPVSEDENNNNNKKREEYQENFNFLEIPPSPPDVVSHYFTVINLIITILYSSLTLCDLVSLVKLGGGEGGQGGLMTRELAKSSGQQ